MLKKMSLTAAVLGALSLAAGPVLAQSDATEPPKAPAPSAAGAGGGMSKGGMKGGMMKKSKGGAMMKKSHGKKKM